MSRATEVPVAHTNLVSVFHSELKESCELLSHFPISKPLLLIRHNLPIKMDMVPAVLPFYFG